MLKHTFRHIHGSGEKTEKRIWAEGLTSWEECLDSPRRAALPQWQRDLVCVELERSVRALERRDARYFTEKLPAPLQCACTRSLGSASPTWTLKPLGSRLGCPTSR